MKYLGNTSLRVLLIFFMSQLIAEGSSLPILKSYRDLDPCDDDQRLTISAYIGEVKANESLFLIEFVIKYDPGVVQYNAFLENAGITGKFSGQNDSRIVNVFSEDSIIVGNIGTFGSTPRWGDEDLFVLSFNYIGDGSQVAKFELLDLYLGDEFSGTFSNTVEDEELIITPLIEDKEDRYFNLFFDKDTLLIENKVTRNIPIRLDIGNYRNLRSGSLLLNGLQSDGINYQLNTIDDNLEIDSIGNSIYNFNINGKLNDDSNMNLSLQFDQEIDTVFDIDLELKDLNNLACITRIENTKLGITSKFPQTNIIEEEFELFDGSSFTLNGDYFDIIIVDRMGRIKVDLQNVLDYKINNLNGGFYIVKIVDMRGRIFIRKLIID